MLLMNLDSQRAVTARVAGPGGTGTARQYELYRLRAGAAGPSGHGLELNGRQLLLGADGALPPMPGLNTSGPTLVNTRPPPAPLAAPTDSRTCCRRPRCCRPAWLAS